MRVAAAGIAAILAAIALALHGAARADQANPFPSPSPVASAAPGAGGWAALDFEVLSGSGGTIPTSISTSTPLPFAAAHASGIDFELASRLSATYTAALRYADVSIHGDDHAIITRFDAAILYGRGSRGGAGLGFTSLQRSTVSSTASGIGVGGMLFPDFGRRTSPYASFFYYPSLPAPGQTRASLAVARLGLAFASPGPSGIFARVGFDAQSFSSAAWSPRSLSGVEIGVGATF